MAPHLIGSLKVPRVWNLPCSPPTLYTPWLTWASPVLSLPSHSTHFPRNTFPKAETQLRLVLCLNFEATSQHL